MFGFKFAARRNHRPAPLSRQAQVAMTAVLVASRLLGQFPFEPKLRPRMLERLGGFPSASSAGYVLQFPYLSHPSFSNGLIGLPDPTNRQLGFSKNLVPVCRHSANLSHSRSPFSCA